MFEYTVAKTDDSVLIQLKGEFDEHASMPSKEELDRDQLIFDFEGLGYVNSLGIRMWILFIDSYVDKKILFKNMSSSLIQTINIVAGFLPEEGRIESFFVPMICETCDVEVSKKFNQGTEFIWNSKEKKLFKFEFKCQGCDNILDLDVPKKKYFKFLS